MALLLSLLSFGCFVGAATTFLRYDGLYFELLIICGVVLLAASEIVSAIRSAASRPAQPSDDLLSAEAIHELKAINDRLVKMQLAIEHLEPPRQLSGS